MSHPRTGTPLFDCLHCGFCCHGFEEPEVFLDQNEEPNYVGDMVEERHVALQPRADRHRKYLKIVPDPRVTNCRGVSFNPDEKTHIPPT